MTFLPKLLCGDPLSSNSFYLAQSSTVQSSLPLLREIIRNVRAKCTVILMCTVYAPSDLLSRTSSDGLQIFDWTGNVPGYGNETMSWESRLQDVQNTIKVFQASTCPIAVVVDSVDILEVDISSPSDAYNFLAKVLSYVNSLQNNSKLICHMTSFCSLLPLLVQPRFTPSLIHLSAHPTALITHISRAFLASPPPSGSSAHSATPDELKFWRAFVPLADRPLDVESLVFGTDEHAEGGGSRDEFVVDVFVRGCNEDVPIAASGKRRNVERFLEGWSVSKSAPVPLEELDSLRGTWRKKTVAGPEAPDPTKDLTFNLNLTDSQQASRSQVPLPYELSGRNHVGQNQGAHIFYDPDSADDLDDEDPDEDLDL